MVYFHISFRVVSLIAILPHFPRGNAGGYGRSRLGSNGNKTDDQDLCAYSPRCTTPKITYTSHITLCFVMVVNQLTIPMSCMVASLGKTINMRLLHGQWRKPEKCGEMIHLWINNKTWGTYYIFNYNDVIMNVMASQVTSLTIVYSTVYSSADQRKLQGSASLAFVWGILRRPVNSLHKWPVTRKLFPFDDVIMYPI